jgi:hypothetical protein
MELPNRTPVVHSIERSNLIDSHWGHLQYPSHFVHHAQAGESVLTLPEIEDRHHGGFLVLWGVAFEDFLDELLVLRREFEGDGRIVFGGIAMLEEERYVREMLGRKPQRDIEICV